VAQSARTAIVVLHTRRYPSAHCCRNATRSAVSLQWRPRSRDRATRRWRRPEFCHPLCCRQRTRKGPKTDQRHLRGRRQHERDQDGVRIRPAVFKGGQQMGRAAALITTSFRLDLPAAQGLLTDDVVSIGTWTERPALVDRTKRLIYGIRIDRRMRRLFVAGRVYSGGWN